MRNIILGIAAAAVLSAFIAFISISLPHGTTSTSLESLRLGEEVPVSIPGSSYYPDGHTTYFRTENGEMHIFLAVDDSTYLLNADTIQRLSSAQKELVLAPSEDNMAFDEYYAGPGSIISAPDGSLLFFYHGEQHPQDEPDGVYIAGIGRARSYDGGRTWEEREQIIAGSTRTPRGGEPAGAGEPSLIEVDGYYYMYYVDWNPDETVGIHLTRSKIADRGAPGTWEYYYQGKFIKSDSFQSTPIILPDEDDPYAGLPGVSWNEYLKSYILTFVGNRGFYITTSENGISWTRPILFMEVQTGNATPEAGEIWYSFPTLLSPDKPNDRITGKDMILLYSKGAHDTIPHSMVYRTVALEETP